jgi:hypothetical protein
MRDTRKAFEEWVGKPPFEYDTRRFSNDETKSAWQGQYRSIGVQLAWEAWQLREARIARLEEALRQAADEMDFARSAYGVPGGRFHEAIAAARSALEDKTQ